MSQWKEYRLDTADDCLRVITKFSEDYAMAYRGQAGGWPLFPLIHRLLPSDWIPHEVALWEAAAIQYFRRHAGSYLTPTQLGFLDTILGTLTLMQHYGAPTRLLDWTLSPWVAAYFAANYHPKDDGIVWAFDRDHLARETQLGITGPQELVA